jgi:hypothetical protein
VSNLIGLLRALCEILAPPESTKSGIDHRLPPEPVRKESSLPPDEMLMKEYQCVVEQIIHWDSHFWRKSQFFLVIQSAFIAGVLQNLKDWVVRPAPMPFLMFLLFAQLTIFNIYLCYVWFRTNRRNREYPRQLSQLGIVPIPIKLVSPLHGP